MGALDVYFCLISCLFIKMFSTEKCLVSAYSSTPSQLLISILMDPIYAPYYLTKCTILWSRYQKKWNEIHNWALRIKSLLNRYKVFLTHGTALNIEKFAHMSSVIAWYILWKYCIFNFQQVDKLKLNLFVMKHLIIFSLHLYSSTYPAIYRFVAEHFFADNMPVK